MFYLYNSYWHASILLKMIGNVKSWKLDETNHLFSLYIGVQSSRLYLNFGVFFISAYSVRRQDPGTPHGKMNQLKAQALEAKNPHPLPPYQICYCETMKLTIVIFCKTCIVINFIHIYLSTHLWYLIYRMFK